MTKKVTLIIAICAACAMLAVGCTRNTASPTPTHTPLTSPLAMTSPSISPLTTTTPGTSPSISPMTSPESSPLNPSATLGMDAAEAADKIKDEVNKLSEVDSAAVVVEGTTALVGVKFDSTYRGEMTTRITDMIKEKAQSVDSNIQEVMVTDDQTMMDEIEDMRANMTGGTLAGDIKAKFDSMLNRLKPNA